MYEHFDSEKEGKISSSESEELSEWSELSTEETDELASSSNKSEMIDLP